MFLFRYYELTVLRAENEGNYLKLSTVRIMNVTFAVNESKIVMNIMKGEEQLKVQDNCLKLNLTGKYNFSVRAVVQVYSKTTFVRNLFGKTSTVCIGKLIFKIISIF